MRVHKQHALLKKSITVDDCDDTTGDEVSDNGDGAAGMTTMTTFTDVEVEVDVNDTASSEAAVHREVEVVLILQRNNQLARTNRGGQGWMREAAVQQKVKQGGGT